MYLEFWCVKFIRFFTYGIIWFKFWYYSKIKFGISSKIKVECLIATLSYTITKLAASLIVNSFPWILVLHNLKHYVFQLQIFCWKKILFFFYLILHDLDSWRILLISSRNSLLIHFLHKKTFHFYSSGILSTIHVDFLFS